MEWIGMEWIGMEWNRMEWNGMEWNGMEWNRMEWTGMQRNGMAPGHNGTMAPRRPARERYTQRRSPGAREEQRRAFAEAARGGVRAEQRVDERRP